MKRWKTTQQMAVDIAKMEKSNNKELNIAQCNVLAKNIKNLYANGGKASVMKHLRDTLPPFMVHGTGFSMDQKDRAMIVVAKLFRYHAIPFSRIRNNMVRIGAVK